MQLSRRFRIHRLETDRAVRHIPLTHGKVAQVDASDYDMLITFRWRAIRNRQAWYAHTYVATGAEEFRHRLVMGTCPEQRIDHKNGDGLDNRRSNLRPTSNTQSQANRRRVRSMSGFKGVAWDSTKKQRPWRAHITIRGRMKFLGVYVTPEEASRAYDAAARKYFGEIRVYQRRSGIAASVRIRWARLGK